MGLGCNVNEFGWTGNKACFQQQKKRVFNNNL